MNNFEKKLLKDLRNGVETPKYVKETIYNLNLNTQSRFSTCFKLQKIKKLVAATLTLITLSGGIVFADEIKATIGTLFDDGTGVKTAIENGYVEDSSSSTISKNTFSDNITIKTGEYLFDNSTLNLKLYIDLKDSNFASNLSKIKFSNLIIYDENDNILLVEDTQSSINKFMDNTSIADSEDEFRKYYINSSYSISVSNISGNHLEIDFKINAADTFPESKELNLAFSNINLYNQEYSNETKLLFEGDYLNNIVVSDSFLNRETIEYTFVDSNNNNIQSDTVRLFVNSTSSKLDMDMYFGDYDYFTNKSEESRMSDVSNSTLILQNKSYIENENGEKFYTTSDNDNSGGYTFNTNGYLTYWETFNFTSFNLTNTLKLVLTTINNEEIILNFINNT